MNANNKILISANSARELELFKGDFISEILARGYQLAIFCKGEERYINALKARGAEVYSTQALRNSLSFLSDISYIRQFYKVFRQFKPDLVFNYTIKPVVYGSILAKISRVKHIYSMFPGLGFIFSRDNLKHRLVQSVCYFLYRISGRCNQKFIFLNREDRNLFLEQKIIPAHKSLLLDGEGVNLQYFLPQALPQNNAITFLFVARLLAEKGIYEYIEAAEKLSALYPNTIFKIAGDCDEKTAPALKTLIETYKNHPKIHYLGYINDIRQLISESHVFVLPSYYREGLPRSSMECMAMGRPIITTDWVGCRETVVEAVNGYLIPIKNTDALANAMIKFIENPLLIAEMGRKSREIAEQRFDIRKINQQLLEIMGIVGY